MSWGILREPPHHLTERPRGQHRVDGVDLPRHRTDAATEAHRVDWWGAQNLIFQHRSRASRKGRSRYSRGSIDTATTGDESTAMASNEEIADDAALAGQADAFTPVRKSTSDDVDLICT